MPFYCESGPNSGQNLTSMLMLLLLKMWGARSSGERRVARGMDRKPLCVAAHAYLGIFPTYGFIVSAFKAYIIRSSSFVE